SRISFNPQKVSSSHVYPEIHSFGLDLYIRRTTESFQVLVGSASLASRVTTSARYRRNSSVETSPGGGRSSPSSIWLRTQLNCPGVKLVSFNAAAGTASSMR